MGRSAVDMPSPMKDRAIYVASITFFVLIVECYYTLLRMRSDPPGLTNKDIVILRISEVLELKDKFIFYSRKMKMNPCRHLLFATTSA